MRPEPSAGRTWLRRIRLAIVAAIIPVTIYALIELGALAPPIDEPAPAPVVVEEEEQEVEQE